MPLRALSQFLDISKVPYRSYNHPPTYTAQDTARLMHISGHEVAKTVILRLDGRLVMAVLPACEMVDLDKFQEMTGALWVELADEDDLEHIAPLCDAGSIPPIGNLFGLPVYVSVTLTVDEIIAFNAGNHTEEIRMYFRDFERLVQPQIMDFSRVH
jgi:Ala-tRNA(Pro) deacylase